MNKYYLLFSAALLFMIACDKIGTDPEMPIPEDQEKFAVNLKVSDFKQVIKDARAGDTSVSNNATMLVYTAFDINTQLIVSQITKYNSDSTFGEFRDSLPEGRYLVAVAAVKDTALSKLTTGGKGLFMTAPGTDIFYANTTINVDGEISQYITLDRVVAKIVYEFTGRIPMDAKKIAVSPNAYPEAPFIETILDFFSGQLQKSIEHYHMVYTYFIPDSLQGGTAVTFSQYILSVGTKIISINAIVTNANSLELFRKDIYSVKTLKNKTTVLTGNLFDSIPSGGGVQVKLNTEWSTDTLKAQF
jgi:hypothetical protein